MTIEVSLGVLLTFFRVELDLRTAIDSKQYAQVRLAFSIACLC